MFSISPMWIIRLVILATLAAACAWGYHHIYKNGWNARDVIAVSDAAKIKAASDAADALAAKNLAEADAKVMALNLSMSKSIDVINTTHQQEISNAKTRIDSLDADLRSTKLRLSIAVTSTSNKGDSTCQSGGAGSATGDSSQRTAVILPEIADSLIHIAAGGDAAVRRANACIDTYNALKEAVNSGDAQ